MRGRRERGGLWGCGAADARADRAASRSIRGRGRSGAAARLLRERVRREVERGRRLVRPGPREVAVKGAEAGRAAPEGSRGLRAKRVGGRLPSGEGIHVACVGVRLPLAPRPASALQRGALSAWSTRWSCRPLGIARHRLGRQTREPLPQTASNERQVRRRPGWLSTAFPSTLARASQPHRKHVFTRWACSDGPLIRNSRNRTLSAVLRTVSNFAGIELVVRPSGLCNLPAHTAYVSSHPPPANGAARAVPHLVLSAPWPPHRPSGHGLIPWSSRGAQLT